MSATFQGNIRYVVQVWLKINKTLIVNREGGYHWTSDGFLILLFTNYAVNKIRQRPKLYR